MLLCCLIMAESAGSSDVLGTWSLFPRIISTIEKFQGRDHRIEKELRGTNITVILYFSAHP